MPIYEYQCKTCGQFEIMRKITDAPLKRCPTCHAKVTKLMSNTSFQLKGSGWYATDYGRGNGASKETGNEKGKESASAKEGTASETASESKPAEKKTGKSAEPAAA